MIYTRLHGRLGNQMFQYAAAAGLAARLGVTVALDDRRALAKGEGSLTRVFDLPTTTPAHLPPAQHVRPLAHALWRLMGRTPRHRREKSLRYNAAIKGWGNESYLHGYWQSAHYFNHIADEIRHDFRIVPPPSAANVEMAARIAAGPSVSLHVRRGDYVALGASAVCDQAYYDAALAAVTHGLGVAPTVYVFSDDPGWARVNLSVPFDKVVVDFNGPDADYEDMRLMSLCQHNVIANSSFSWWSAWLNESRTKRVAAPARWFGNDHQTNPDILPEGWLRITS